MWNDFALVDRIERAAKAGERRPSELYRNTAGEIEARDVANRLDMTDEERMATPPDLGDENTVFAEGADVGYSIETLDGEAITVLNVNNARQYKAVAAYLKAIVSSDHPFATILADSTLIYVGKDLPGEYLHSEATESLPARLKKVKMRAAGGLDEMLLLAQNGEWQENRKEKHKIDAKYGWYRYKTRFAAPVFNQRRAVDHYTVYSGTLLIRNDADGKSYLYDLLGIKKEREISAASFSAKPRLDMEAPIPPLSDSIPKSIESVNPQNEISDETDSRGRQLTRGQETFFEDSVVRNRQYQLIPVYHATDSSFTTFDRDRLGRNTLGNATDWSLAATSLIGHWFADHDVSTRIGSSGSSEYYVNITNPYTTSLYALAEELRGYAADDAAAQEAYDGRDYAPAREAAQAYVEQLQDDGYDGLAVRDEEFGGTSYVVFDSAQAKLTSNLSPSDSPDIRYSLAGDTADGLNLSRARRASDR